MLVFNVTYQGKQARKIFVCNAFRRFYSVIGKIGKERNQTGTDCLSKYCLNKMNNYYPYRMQFVEEKPKIFIAD